MMLLETPNSVSLGVVQSGGSWFMMKSYWGLCLPSYNTYETEFSTSRTHRCGQKHLWQSTLEGSCYPHWMLLTCLQWKVQAVGSTWRNGFGRCFFLSGKCSFRICLSSQELAYCGSLMNFAHAICIHMHHTAVFRMESKSPLVASKTFQSSKHRLHGCSKAFPVTHPVDSQSSFRWKPTLAAETPGTIAWEKVFRKPLRCGFRFPGIKLPWDGFYHENVVGDGLWNWVDMGLPHYSRVNNPATIC